jgi:hypothetical protein
MPTIISAFTSSICSAIVPTIFYTDPSTNRRSKQSAVRSPINPTKQISIIPAYNQTIEATI